MLQRSACQVLLSSPLLPAWHRPQMPKRLLAKLASIPCLLRLKGTDTNCQSDPCLVLLAVPTLPEWQRPNLPKRPLPGVVWGGVVWCGVVW